MSVTTHRRLAAVALTTACLVSTLTACGGGSSSSEDATTIRFLGHTGLKASMDKVIADFESAHPDVTVRAEYAPAGPTFGQTLITQIQGGNAPDVLYGNGGTGATESLIPLAEAGDLLDLSDQPWVSSVPEAARPLYQVDGKTYGLLMDVAPHGLLYNSTALKELGIDVPQTFDDVLAVCKTARGNDKYGISLSGQSAGYAAEIIAASSLYATTPDWDAQRAAGTVTFAGTAGWKDTLQRLTELREADCFQPGAESASTPQSFQVLTAGQALMTIVPSGALGSVAGDKPEDWAMTAFPGDSVDSTRVAVGYQDGLAVSAKTTHKAAALEFLKYVATDGAVTRAQLSGTVTLADAAAAKLPTALAGFEPYYAADHTIARPHDLWQGGGSLNALNTAVVAAMTGQSSVEAALTTVDEAWGR